MLIWPVLALLVVLLFYKRDITPAWNPVIKSPPAALPQLPPPQELGPPMDLNDVFRRRG